MRKSAFDILQDGIDRGNIFTHHTPDADFLNDRKIFCSINMNDSLLCAKMVSQQSAQKICLLTLRNRNKTIQFLFKSPSYWCFDYWESLEKSHNKRSIFYVYAQSGKTNLTSWLIDPSYQISNNGKLIDRLKKLIDAGFEIGLHGSYRSAFDKILLELEKKSLEESLGIPITRVRQHWLNYQEDTTPYLHNQLFETDSTLAWNDRMGYRSGCASKYRPYDHCNNQPFKYMEIPQIIMDSQLYDYATEEPEKMTKTAKSMLENLAKFKNVYVSISWHQRVCSNDYNWQKSYEKLITI